MKFLIATEKPFAPAAVKQIREIIENAGHETLLLEKYTDKKDLLNAVANADAMIVRSDIVDKEVLDAAKNLKIVVRAGAGYDNVDLQAATANGVCVMNTPGQNSNAVAELVFGMLLNLVRSGFDGASGSELRGKKLGLHAFGYIGKLVAQIANGFGMEVFAYSPSLARNPEIGKEFNVTGVKSPEELYEKSEIVSLHMPANDQTKGSINYELLSKLPQNGIVINTARKEVANEADMVRIMEERPKFKYATDIKPNNHDTMVEKFGNRYLASAKKCGAQTGEANVNAGLAAAEQIVKFFASGDETFRVNPK
ncbi:MAG: NAD(P)-dependent oxidoreductase [Bacteroidia bacterium]|nr:NAD(P)-dependent oxidoreductase [Bacteroidia bacterium]